MEDASALAVPLALIGAREVVQSLSKKKVTLPKKKTASSKKKTVRGGGLEGGGIASELGKLAIPLALIAAKEGVETLSKKRVGSAKASSAKAPSSMFRRRTVGGNGGVVGVSHTSMSPAAVTLGGARSCGQKGGFAVSADFNSMVKEIAALVAGTH